jgi:transcription antitermination factor NusA-like protein
MFCGSNFNMKTPICDICLRSSILCSACESKVKNGEISEADVRVSRALFYASEKFKSLRGITIKKVLETENNILLIPEKGDASKIIGRGGLVAKELTKTLGKNFRVIEETSDKREFIEKMIFPAKVTAMNVLYAEDGEVLKVMVSRKPSVSEDTLREVMKEVYNEDIRIVDE